jgi:CheY-like chemotaxis protein
MKCPRCKAAVTTLADSSGLIICAKCGARLRSKAAAAEAAPPPASASARTGSETLPPVGAAASRAGSETVMAEGAVGRLGADTLPPAGQASRRSEGAVLAPPAEPEPAARKQESPWPDPPAGFEALFEEIRAVRMAQDEILALLRGHRVEEGTSFADTSPAGRHPDDTVPPPVPVRTRRRKTVLLIDDDPATRIAALKAFELAEVPTRTAQDGNAGLAAIAQEKPDVIVLELGVGGDMSGKDVVNMVKATMEWVDVPIVLYTRVPIESQKEARTIHGADELVPKGVGAPEALVARVIALFRKG